MPFNNGTFIKIPVVKDTEITADGLNTVTEDIAAGLSQTFLRDGSIALTGDFKAGNHKLTGLKNGTADTDAATVGQLSTIQGNAVLLTGDQTIAGIKTFTSSPVVPTPSANDSSTKVATTKWVNTTGNNVVHRTGTETIVGAKTFIDNPYINNSVPRLRLLNTNITKGTAPSTDQGIAINFQDKDGNALGGVQTTYYTNKNVYTYLRSTKADTNTDTAGSTLGVMYPATGDPYATAPTTTATTSTTSTQIATAGWVNSTGNNLVHLTGNEIITGKKTFTYDIYMESVSPNIINRNTSIKKGTNPTEELICGGIYNFESSGNNQSNQLSAWTSHLRTDGTTFVSMGVYKNQANSIDNATIRIYYPKASDPYTEAPIPTTTTSTSSTQIATTGWVNTIGNNVVHRTSIETISGTKTFTSDPKISNDRPSLGLLESSVTKGTNPDTEQIWAIDCYDGSDNSGDIYRLGLFTTHLQSSGLVYTDMRAYKNIAGNSDNAAIRVLYPASGNPYTYAPASDVNNSIVTTINKSKSQNGYFELGNGLIIQWGTDTNTIVNRTITFEKAFSSSTSYGLAFISINNTITGDYTNLITDRTNTTFKVGTNKNITWIAIGY